MRQKLNDASKGEFKLSVNDFVVKAAALALRKVPAVNSSWGEDAIRRFHNVDINIAVNTDRGLYTPIVRDADKVGLAAINGIVKDMAEKAKQNKLSLNDLQVIIHLHRWWHVCRSVLSLFQILECLELKNLQQ